MLFNFKQTFIQIETQNSIFSNNTNFNYIENRGNFTIKVFNKTIYSVTNLDTNSFKYYDINQPHDKHQFVLNLTEGCNLNNCGYPNICLSETVCACDNFYANYNKDEMINITNKKYCIYERKNQVVLSILEVILPGVGFIYIRYYTYGILKFIISSFFIFIGVLKLVRFFEKDKLPNYILHSDLVEYSKDMHFYFTIAASVILIIWMIIDLVLIGFKIIKDPNGVNFQIRQIFEIKLS